MPTGSKQNVGEAILELVIQVASGQGRAKAEILGQDAWEKGAYHSDPGGSSFDCSRLDIDFLSDSRGE
jgi:hypothetical protein